jgi:hypothetical protein
MWVAKWRGPLHIFARRSFLIPQSWLDPRLLSLGKTFDLLHGLTFLFWQNPFFSWLNIYLLTQLFLFIANLSFNFWQNLLTSWLNLYFLTKHFHFMLKPFLFNNFFVFHGSTFTLQQKKIHYGYLLTKPLYFLAKPLSPSKTFQLHR